MELEFYQETPGWLRSVRAKRKTGQPAGQFRWRLTASNGEVVGASTEGYRHRADARANAEQVTNHSLRPSIQVIETW